MDTTKRIIFTIALAIVAVGLFINCHPRPSVHGQSLTTTGPMPGVFFIFDSTGAPMSSFYCARLTGNSTTSGTFSLTGTGPLQAGSPLWTNPSGAFVRSAWITSSGTAIAQSYTPYSVALVVVSNAITVTGTVKSPTTLVVLGATAVSAAVAEPMTVEVCSN